jgi:hypothetical protein
VDLFQTIGFGVCPKKEWLVRAVVGYYDLMNLNTGSRECTMLEVKIQVSPLSAGLSDKYRETVHHLKLIDGARDDYPQFQPQVVVSEDRRNLAVLLFHPHQQSSAVVIFQLRKPRSDLNPSSLESLPPLPKYIQSSQRNESPAVATHPHFVSVWGISSICSIPQITPCVFLAVCNDGSLIWLDARSSTAIATGMLSVPPDTLPISSLQVTAETLERGHLLAVSSNKCGHLVLAQWNLKSSTAIQQTKLERNSTGALKTRSLTEVDEFAASNTGTKKVNSSKSDSSERNAQPKRPPGRAALNSRRVSSAPSYSHNNNNTTNNNGESNHETFQSAFKGFWQNQRSPRKTTNTDTTGSNFDWNRFQFKSSQNSKASQYTKKSTTTLQQEQQQQEIKKEKEASLLKEAKRRRSHMELKVLKELQRQALSGKWVTHSIVNGRQGSMKRRRRRSEGPSNEPTTTRAMKTEVLYILKEKVVAAHFGSLPTIVCVAYQASTDHPTIAQVFGVDELGQLFSLKKLWLNSEHFEESHNLQSTNAIVSDEEWDTANSLTTKFGLDHSEDSLAISTAFGDKWIGCVWNWRQNVLGFSVKNEANSALWSRLYFSSNQIEGSGLTYLESGMRNYQIQVRKNVIPTAILSPYHSHGSLFMGEQSSLLLGNDSISFPHSKPRGHTMELEWKLSSVPSGYIQSYGPVKLAAIGRSASSHIAIASKRGLCVLDTAKSKWRQFGTPSEESSFSVVSMVFWEGAVGGKDGTDDWLVAIIQSRTGRQYLSCWSPKRLNFANQLLIDTSGEKREEKEQIAWGIPLMKDIKATSLSIISQPLSKRAPGLRKAVVFVSSVNSDELRYVAFQLQLIKPSKATPLNSTIKAIAAFGVLAKRVVAGSLKDGSRSIGPISSVYLAGASFRFDLTTAQHQKEEESFVATIGVTRTPGGLEVISLNKDNKVFLFPVINAHEVSNLWLVDTMYGTNRGILIHIWAVQFLNGDLFSWSVPSLIRGEKIEEEYYLLKSLQQETKLPKGLHPPSLVCQKASLSKKKRFLLGILSHVGTTSDWMQSASFGSTKEMNMGIVPRSAYGCGLKAGQSLKNVHRMTRFGETETEKFTTNVFASKLFGPTEISMTPPAFVTSLYGMLLEAAHLRTQVEESKMDEERLSVLQDHIRSRLQTSPNKDAVAMALQLLIMRSVEMIAHTRKKHDKEQSDATASSKYLAMALCGELVQAIRNNTTNLQFASLFLEVGRQMEPSLLIYLFPLPLPLGVQEYKAHALNRNTVRTVVDLFSLCLEEGSLAASASALPLLQSRTQSRYYCNLLLQTSLKAFVDNSGSRQSEFDTTEEARRVMGDIFRFGIKLEDAQKLMDQEDEEQEKLEQHGCDNVASEHDDSSSEDTAHEGVVEEDGDNGSEFSSNDDGSDSDFSSSSVDDDSFKEEKKELLPNNAMCNVGRNLFSHNQKEKEEDAIRRSAIQFIGSGDKSSSSLDFLTIEKTGSFITTLDDLQSMGEIVGGELVNLLCSPQTDRPWKATACLSRMLLTSNPPPDQVFCNTASQMQPDDVDKFVPNDGLIRDPMGRLTEFLVSETGLCGSQLSEVDASRIVDLVLVLLERLANNSSQTSSGGLVLVGLIAASTANREVQLLADIPQDCYISKAHKLVSYSC